MSVICRSTVGGISVYCRWYIGQLSFEYQSCVNLSGESNGFFLSKDVINYCYHAMGNMWQCKARLRYEENRRALGTKDMITFFFPVCIITDRLSFSC